mgnify:CR=1 FL=1
MTTQIQFSTFNFKNFPVRTITDPNSEIWFCGTDVCDILGYSNAPDALRKHCKGYRETLYPYNRRGTRDDFH